MMASGAMTPIDPGSLSSEATSATTRSRTPAPDVVAISSRPGFSRTDTGAPSPVAIRGRSRAAYSITLAGTRKPRSSTSTWLPGLPRCASDSSHESVAHGVVPWAMSPRTVAAPVLQRRPTARSCMGERSCASSRTTCPRLGVRVRWSASSSRSTVSARDQRAAPFVRGGLSHNRIRCSSSDRRPAACFASHAASESRVKRTALASRAGQSCAAYRFTAVLRATESWTRSSGESPLRSICSSTAWASRWGSICRAAS